MHCSPPRSCTLSCSPHCHNCIYCRCLGLVALGEEQARAPMLKLATRWFPTVVLLEPTYAASQHSQRLADRTTGMTKRAKVTPPSQRRICRIDLSVQVLAPTSSTEDGTEALTSLPSSPIAVFCIPQRHLVLLSVTGSS
eukprot:m.4458 g.4458  ORF g.4458 m.4458 type:complete len:139 (+) comp4497_c0_seq1:231-647(+)